MKRVLLALSLICFAATVSAQTIGIVGPAANGWPDANNMTPDIMLTDNGNGTYSINGLTLTTGSAKFREDQQWTTSYGGSTFPSGMVSGADIPVVAGIYDIVLDLNSNTYTFISASSFTPIELVGTAFPASGNPQMATIDGINYELTVNQFGTGDIQFQEVGTTTFYGSSSFPSGTAIAGATSIPVTSAYYRVSFNLNTLNYSFDIPQVGIVGPAAAGWPVATNTDVVMNTTDGDVYTLDAEVLNDGALKFRQDLNWNVSWGGAAFPSGTIDQTGADIVATAGTYDIVFSRTNQTYAFTTTLSTDYSSFDLFKVYPNPSNNVWFFENPQASIKSIHIYDSLGKLVFDSQPESHFGKVKADVFVQGIYLARVTLDNGSQTTVKIFKK
jgi:hypothetical protein